MAVSCATGTLNITTGAPTSTVVVSGLSFQPKAVLFWWNGLTAASNGTRTTGRKGMGWAASSSSFRALATYDEDAAGTSVSKNLAVTDGCILECGNAGSMVGKADLQSFDSGGFTLEIVDAFVTDFLVHYWAIGGSDITDVEIGSFTAAGVAPVNQVVNNSGNFQPNVTFFMIVSTGSNADSALLFGAATGSSNEATHNSGANDAATSGATGSYCLGSECIAFHTTNPSTAPTMRAEFVSHNASPGGFTINWLERGFAWGIYYLSIKGGSWIVGDLLTQTDTVTAITESGFGFTPAGLLVVSAGNAQTTQDATPAAHDKWSIGCATGASARNCCQLDSRNGNTAMFVHLASRTDCVYVNTDPAQTNHTTTGLMDIQSFDTNAGFTAIMDDADPAQAFAWYVAVGNVEAVTANRRRRVLAGAT